MHPPVAGTAERGDLTEPVNVWKSQGNGQQSTASGIRQNIIFPANIRDEP